MVAVNQESRWRSWALYTSIAALVAYLVKQYFGIEIGGVIDGLLECLLPVLVAFGIINDPTTRGKLLGEGQKWYQSWAVWLCFGTLAAYVSLNIFGVDIGADIAGFMTVLEGVFAAFGIINNPTNAKGL